MRFFFDLGVMQTMLGIPASDILLASEVDFVNKGGTSEMFAGLEIQKFVITLTECSKRLNLKEFLLVSCWTML